MQVGQRERGWWWINQTMLNNFSFQEVHLYTGWRHMKSLCGTLAEWWEDLKWPLCASGGARKWPGKKERALALVWGLADRLAEQLRKIVRPCRVSKLLSSGRETKAQARRAGCAILSTV